jgi:hypothetical protein
MQFSPKIIQTIEKTQSEILDTNPSKKISQILIRKEKSQIPLQEHVSCNFQLFLN